MKYVMDNLPVKDSLLKKAKFVNFRAKDDATFSQVEYFVERLVLPRIDITYNREVNQ